MSDDDRRCPECGTALPIKAKSCACGWGRRRPRIREIDGDPLRGQCTWEGNGMRCRYPGTCGEGTNGTGPWFCRWHFRCGDPVFGARLVEESQGYIPEDDKASFESAVYESSLRKRGLTREPGESIDQFATRCRKWLMANLKRVSQPLPYDPSKRYADEPMTMDGE